MTLVLGFAAVNTGNNLIYLLVSALLGFMAVSGLLGQQNLKQLMVDLRPPEEMYAGHPTLLRVRVRNQRRYLPGFLLQLNLGGDNALLPVVEAGGERGVSLPLTPVGRGYQSLPHLWVSSRFPINFFIRSRRLPDSPRFLVFPAPRQASLPVHEGPGRSDTSTDIPQPGLTGELQSITDYRGLEPLKDIHWKLSARHDDLKVKRFSRQQRQPVLLDPRQVTGRDLDERLGRCCFLINQMIANQQPVGLQLVDRTILPDVGKTHRLRLLQELALYDQG